MKPKKVIFQYFNTPISLDQFDVVAIEHVVADTNSEGKDTDSENEQANINDKAAVAKEKRKVHRSTVKAKIRTSINARYGFIPEHLVDGTSEDPAESNKFLRQRKAKWCGIILDVS